MKERLVEFLAYLGMGQTKFEERVGLSRGLINKIKRNISLDSLAKIEAAYPELNENWLKTGEGEMLKKVDMRQKGEQNIQVSGNVSGEFDYSKNKSETVFHGTANAGRDVHLHSNGGKDKVIEKQEEQVYKSYDVLTSELHRFHETNLSKDDYIKTQDEYIARIVKSSFERNERNMERIDNLIKQQNKLLEAMNDATHKTREQIDRLLDQKSKLSERINFLTDKLLGLAK